ncbi:MAG: hypothetical protein ABIO85_10580 [Sphingomicrobium sp.]
MATPTNPPASKTSTGRRSAAPRKASAARKAPKSTIAKASDAVTGTAVSLVDTIKANPVASAAIAAGVAGAGALIWANRSQIAEQASALGEKAGEIGGKLGERASAVGEKVSAQASAIGEKVIDKYSSMSASPAKTQQEIAEEALSLKQTGDESIAEESQIGAIAY